MIPYQMQEDSNEEEDLPQQAVNNLLSKELLQLSIEDRTAIQEEIHGVTCLAREETPHLLEKSLVELAMALENDDFIPPQKKQAYIRSQQYVQTYVNDESFRLRFLRFALFNAKKAAEQIAQFLDVAAELFGVFALQRAVRLSDFDNHDLKYLREGEFQFLPFRDRSGRRIMAVMNPLMPRNDPEIFRSRARIMLYTTWTAGEDIDVQRKGLVFLVRFTAKYEPSAQDMYQLRDAPRYPYHVLVTTRPSAIHICSPDRPMFRFAQSIILFRIKQLGRVKIKIHYGESVELQYALHSYGIPTEHIPLTFSGNIKDGYIKQWVKMRGYLESQKFDFRPIECPQLDDVLFRQGVSSLSYPGNSRVHRFVERRYELDPDINPKRGTVKSKREKVVLEVMNDIRTIGGRFLVWNENGWWSEILDSGSLSIKLEYFIKEVLRTKRKEERLAKSQHRLNLECSTSVFHIKNDGGSCVSNKRTKYDHYWNDDVRG